MLHNTVARGFNRITPHFAVRRKILIGFYQIASKIESVYDLFLPAEVRQVLYLFRFVVSFGIDGIPLSCVGAGGYFSRVLFWTVAPAVLATSVVSLGVAWHLWIKSAGRTSGSAATVPTGANDWLALLGNLAPIVLRMAFLAYPIVTNVAFEAFSCFIFEDGSSYLIADVAIQCSTDDVSSPEHFRSKAVGVFAVTFYAIGLFALNCYLLSRAQKAIRTSTPTALSNAISFLHREYTPQVRAANRSRTLPAA